MLTIQAILTAAAGGPDAVKALCAPLTDAALRAEIERVGGTPSSEADMLGVACGHCDQPKGETCGTKAELPCKPHRERRRAALFAFFVQRDKARSALTAELSRRTLVDPGWECECGHVNSDDAEHCAGEKCVAFREWAATQPQEDQ